MSCGFKKKDDEVQRWTGQFVLILWRHAIILIQDKNIHLALIDLVSLILVILQG